MSVPTNTILKDSAAIPNGSGAAAILSAGIGSFAVAFFAIAADKSALMKNLFVFYKPTGALWRNHRGHSTVACHVGSSRFALAKTDCISWAYQHHRACAAWPQSVADISAHRRSFLNLMRFDHRY